LIDCGTLEAGTSETGIKNVKADTTKHETHIRFLASKVV
jgi:hypothetical protein